ncbi:hypothetical protein JB92DRAFT_2827018 [Gautieria morchelliformis]|nr:hypothetical protein JB92DRAFT_2827018 [Gautieria morchelliformis]
MAATCPELCFGFWLHLMSLPGFFPSLGNLLRRRFCLLLSLGIWRWVLPLLASAASVVSMRRYRSGILVLLIGSSLVGASCALNSGGGANGYQLCPTKGLFLTELFRPPFLKIISILVGVAAGHIKATPAITFLKYAESNYCKVWICKGHPTETTMVHTFKIGVDAPAILQIFVGQYLLWCTAPCFPSLSRCSMLDDMPVAREARRASIPCMKSLACTMTELKHPLPQEMDRNVSAEAKEKVSSRCRGCRAYAVLAHCDPPQVVLSKGKVLSNNDNMNFPHKIKLAVGERSTDSVVWWSWWMTGAAERDRTSIQKRAP